MTAFDDIRKAIRVECDEKGFAWPPDSSQAVGTANLVLRVSAVLLEHERASRQAWAEEAMALREKLERLENQVLNRSAALFSGILVGIGGDHDTPPSDEQNWRAVGLIERAIRREMGLGYVTQAEDRLLRAVESNEVCACSIDAAALDPERWSRPQCAVHPEGGTA